MMPLERISGVAALAASLVLAAQGATAATLKVAAGDAHLRNAVAASAAGDVLELASGIHYGPIRIERALTLKGEAGAVIDGQGKGSTIEVTVPDVTIRDLEIRNSGIDNPMYAGVFLQKTAERATVENNRLDNNLVGIYVHGARDSMVRDNTIVGRKDLRLNDRGNGVYVWNAPGTQVIDNDISMGRDGIFTNVSKNNVFRGNRMHNLRFAIHYMYTNDSQVIGNTSIGNHVGLAIMYSDRLQVRDNTSVNDRDHGLLLNYANMSDIDGNSVYGAAKCVFIYNANKNNFHENRFENCGIGIHFTAGSERNVVNDNAFINNETQVKYVSTRSLDWSYKGRGNYWSDNPAFDLNGDGLADTAYRPNDIIDQVVWRYPTAKLLLNSPAVQVIRWAQSQFPALHPGGVIDSAPLMKPPARPGPVDPAFLHKAEKADG